MMTIKKDGKLYEMEKAYLTDGGYFVYLKETKDGILQMYTDGYYKKLEEMNDMREVTMEDLRKGVGDYLTHPLGVVVDAPFEEGKVYQFSDSSNFQHTAIGHLSKIDCGVYYDSNGTDWLHCRPVPKELRVWGE